MPLNIDTEDSIAMACIAVLSVFGLLSNGLSLYITRTKRCFRNAFGVLCSCFLICNLQAIVIHCTWCITILILKNPILSTPTLFFVRLMGLLLNGGWFGSLLIHFFIAINRFCAFAFATRYNQLWSESRAFIVAVSTWTFGMIFCTHHLFRHCALIFNENSTYRWAHYDKICGNVDAIISTLIVMGMGCVDFTTLIKIISYRRAMRRNVGISMSNANKERDILFFKQSCIFGLFYVSTVFVFNINPYFFTNKWVLFVSGTIAWLLTHGLDGLTFLIFNRSMICKMGFCSGTITPALNLNQFQTTTRQ